MVGLDIESRLGRGLTGIRKFLSEIKDVQCMVVHGFNLTTGRQSHNGFL